MLRSIYKYFRYFCLSNKPSKAETKSYPCVHSRVIMVEFLKFKSAKKSCSRSSVYCPCWNKHISAAPFLNLDERSIYLRSEWTFTKLVKKNSWGANAKTLPGIAICIVSLGTFTVYMSMMYD